MRSGRLIKWDYLSERGFASFQHLLHVRNAAAALSSASGPAHQLIQTKMVGLGFFEQRGEAPVHTNTLINRHVLSQCKQPVLLLI